MMKDVCLTAVLEANMVQARTRTSMMRNIVLTVIAIGLEAVVSSAQAQRMGTMGARIGAPTMGSRFGGPAIMAPGRAATGTYFNPKELTIDKPVPWQKQTSRPGVGILKSSDGGRTYRKKSGPKTITTCVLPGSTVPVRC
jgi:hypothetical protein